MRFFQRSVRTEPSDAVAESSGEPIAASNGMDEIIALVDAKLAEIQRLRDLQSGVTGTLAEAIEELARAEEALAGEQSEAVLADPRAVKRTPSLRVVLDHGERITLLKAQRTGLKAKIRGALSELHELENQLDAAAAEWKAGEISRVEREYLAAAETFGNVMALAAAQFDSLDARRQSHAIRESRINWDDPLRPLIRIFRGAENPASLEPRVIALGEQRARATTALQAIREAGGQVPEQQPEAASA